MRIWYFTHSRADGTGDGRTPENPTWEQYVIDKAKVGDLAVAVKTGEVSRRGADLGVALGINYGWRYVPDLDPAGAELLVLTTQAIQASESGES